MPVCGSCHCGSVRWSYQGIPESVTSCNCTVCRRYGALWIYGQEGETIEVTGATKSYIRDVNPDTGSRGDLEFRSCMTCACMVCWYPANGTAGDDTERAPVRMAVNARLAEPKAVSHLPIRIFDGLQTFSGLPSTGLCVGDVWPSTQQTGLNRHQDKTVSYQSSSVASSRVKPPHSSHIRLDFFDPPGHVVVELLWEAAPRTCAALLAAMPDGTEVMSCHARHSGAEALFLTPEVIRDVGDENTTLDYEVGDFLFGYEPKGICQHASEDASEVAWIYHGAAFPRRWESNDGDPTNQRGPWHCVDVALNKWGKAVEEKDFYSRCGRMPRTGEQKLVVTHCNGWMQTATSSSM